MTHAFLSLTQPEVLRFPDPKGFMIINAIYILLFFAYTGVQHDFHIRCPCGLQ